MIKKYLTTLVGIAAVSLTSLTTTTIQAEPDSSSTATPEKNASTGKDDWQPLYCGNLDDFRIYFRGQGYIDDVHSQDVFVAEPKQIHVRKGTNGLIVTKVPHSYYHVKVDYRWGAKGGSMNAGLMTHVDLAFQMREGQPAAVR